MIRLSAKDDNVSTMNALGKALTADFPSEHARIAWLALETIHKRKRNADKFELQQLFNPCDLKLDQTNPDEWVSELETYRSLLYLDFQYNITDDELLSHIVFNIKPKINTNC
jgi:hypothetical protein